MVTVDQMMIKDIPASAVPWTLPVCETHNVITVRRYTRKFPEESVRRLRVLRMCRCPECHKEGIDDIAVVNHRDFP